MHTHTQTNADTRARAQTIRKRKKQWKRTHTLTHACSAVLPGMINVCFCSLCDPLEEDPFHCTNSPKHITYRPPFPFSFTAPVLHFPLPPSLHSQCICWIFDVVCFPPPPSFPPSIISSPVLPDINYFYVSPDLFFFDSALQPHVYGCIGTMSSSGTSLKLSYLFIATSKSQSQCTATFRQECTCAAEHIFDIK